MKKIIIIGPTYPYRGGNSLFVSFLYELLSKEYQVKIYNYKLLYPQILFPGRTQYDLSEDVKKIESIRILNSINPFNWIKVARKINKESPDLIIFDWWHPFFAFCHFGISSLLKEDLKKKVVFITENIVSHEKNLFENILTKIGLFNSKYFIVLSKQVENELRKFFRDGKIYRSELPIYSHLKTNLSQINEARKKFNLDENDNVIMFFGYVRKYKGLDVLIESLSLLLKSQPQLNLKLLVAGEFYEDKKFYLDLIERLNLKNRILIFDEYIPNEKVKDFFIASDLVVLPYRSATQSGILNLSYGFSKPVVITNVGGLSEFVIPDRTGIIADESTPDSISKAITKFFELRKDIDFEKNIEEYCQKNNFNDFNRIISDVLNDIDTNLKSKINS